MRLSDRFRQLRTPYVARFETGLFSLGAQHSILVEPAPRDDRGEPILSGPLSLPSRADVVIMTNEGGSPMEFASEGPPANFEKIDLSADGLALVVESFAWDQLRCSIRGEPGNYDWNPTREFFASYFSEGADEVQSGRGAKPRGLIHALDGPVYRHEMTWLKLDLGTAPAEVLLDFLGALRSGGVEAAWFSSGFVSF